MTFRVYAMLAFCIVFTRMQAQNAMDTFVADACNCFQGIKPETITTADAINDVVAKCLDGAITANKKALKKQNILDWDKGATQEQVEDLWQRIFKKCNPVTDAIFARKEKLEEAEAGGSFWGLIFYVQDIEIGGPFKKMGITKEALLDDMKKEGKWADTLYSFHKLGNYARIGNNKEQLQKVYVANENTIYTYNGIGDGVCSVQEAIDLDLKGAPDKPTVIELDSTATIMGLSCKIIRMKWKISQIDYYYNSTQAQVNPELFAQHSSEGLSEFVKRSKCLPLQIVTNAIGMTVIQTAFGIKPGKFDNDMLSVPELVEDPSLNVMKIPGIKMMRIKE